MSRLLKIVIGFMACSALAAAFALILALLSPAGRWDFGLWLGQRDYDYITGLRDQLRREPTNRVVLAEILARTQSPNSFSRGNAIGVLTQLSYYNTATGRQIHAQTLPIFEQALDERGDWSDTQPIKRAALEGLENLGPYAASAIPRIRQMLSDPDPIIRQDAKEALDRLEKCQTNRPSHLEGS